MSTEGVEVQRWAQRRSAQLRLLYVHTTVSSLLLGLAFIIDLVASRDSTWFQWPALVFGVLWAVHTAHYAAGGAFLDEDWQRRKAAQLVRRRTGTDA